MAPSSRILVYQVLPNNEIAADYLPFNVEAAYPHDVQVGFSAEEVRPGDPVDINVLTQGEARVGLVAVDKSVFILAENRLNLQQVFNDLERLYLEPQAELHAARPLRHNHDARRVRDLRRCRDDCTDQQGRAVGREVRDGTDCSG